jgi:hypothetical protein
MYSKDGHKMGVVLDNTKLKSYFIGIKSHTEAPDYGDDCEAPTFEVAVKMLTNSMNSAISQHPDGIRYGGFWNEEEVRKHVNEIKD